MAPRNLKKTKKLLASLQEVLGDEVTLADLKYSETSMDRMIQAQSVVNYFESRGSGFRKLECEMCKLVFAYSYPVDTIKCCSVTCMAAKLKSIGLTWNLTKPYEQRWGKFVPAIVPPAALDFLDQLLAELPID